MEREQGSESPAITKPCPACRTPIALGATRCRYCGYNIQFYAGNFRQISEDQLAAGQWRQLAGRDLTKAAEQDELTLVSGRKIELDQILRLMFEGYGRSILVVGNEGVGKTHFVQSAALAAYERTKRTKEPCQIIECYLAALESGAVQVMENIRYFLSLQQESPQLIVLFDVITPILDTEPAEDTPTGLLSKNLAAGTLHCIGTITPHDYDRVLRQRPAMLQQFETIRLAPLSDSATFEVLKQRRHMLQRRYDIVVGDEALKAAITMTAKYMPKLDLPGKAISILDHACRRYRNKLDSKLNLPAAWLDEHTMKHLDTKVGPHDVKRAITEAASIDIEEIEAEGWRRRLEERLKQMVVGQDTALEHFAEAATRMRLHFGESRSLSGFMVFGGPQGVGKVHTAKAFAIQLLGTIEDLTIFDMNQYTQADASARLFGWDRENGGNLEAGAIAGAVRGVPLPILVFDGVELAHSSIFDTLLPVLATGSLKDDRGNELRFGKSILFMTMNCPSPPSSASHTPGSLRALVRERMKSEIAERIQGFIPFKVLSPSEVRAIARRLLERFYRELKPLRIGLRIHDLAYQELIRQGASPTAGVSSLPEVLDATVIQPTRQAVKAKGLRAGDVLEVGATAGKITISTFTKHDLA